MPVPRGHWLLPPVQVAGLAPQQTPVPAQRQTPPWLPPPEQIQLPVRAQLRTYRLAPVRQAEAAIVRRTRRAAEQWE
jgi:hypothetical protein